ncbi:V-set and immunoglobulin domain-containing protein 10 [Collichthys lucidus]|nr:V-set and immunoglobulin domain-containing protein 10 [Collichthys lucidus]
MKIVATVALLQLCLSATAEVSGNGFTETVLTAALGDVVLLPCYDVGTATPTLTTWMKDGREVIRGGGTSPSPSPAGQRLAVLPSGSLNINGAIPGDEGTYLCNSTIGNISYVARVVLQVASGPENVSISIAPATALSNGTLIAFRGTTVSFNCSGSSRPSQELRWSFTDVPDRHPECMWVPAQDPSHIQFNCTWFGAYPPPTLRWAEEQGAGHVYASEVTASLSVTLNRSALHDNQTLRCMAQHLALAAGKKKSCSFTLSKDVVSLQYPEGEPLAMAQETTSVTLTCTETASIPPADTTWRKGLQQEIIVPSSKYVLSEEGPTFKLTIHNISKDDEGVYFCRSENPSLCPNVEEDRGDVLSLVESEDEHIFQDDVPRLPPLTNGCHTTLVQIHRIPSSDHEDAETAADTSPEQQEESVQTEEPADLVTF